MLRRAAEWRSKTGLVAMPCSMKLLEVDDQKLPRFYDHLTYERVVEAAAKVSPEALAIVLLGGDAGLRLGEILGSIKRTWTTEEAASHHAGACSWPARTATRAT